jgi:exosortase/archaeosortase family protein
LASAKFLLKLIGFHVTVNYKSCEIFINSYLPIHLDYFYLSLKHIFIISIVGLITPAKIQNRLLFLFIGACVLITYNILRISLLSVFVQTAFFGLLFDVSMLIRNILVLLLIYFFWQHYTEIKSKIKELLNFSEKEYHFLFIKLVLVFVITFAIETLVFGNILPQVGFFLTQTLLHISQWISNLFGYVSYVGDRTINGYGTYVYMADACLGIDLMLLFASFVYLIPAKWFHKLWFISTGILIIYLINAIRVSLVFMHLANHGGHYRLPVEIHDLFSYPIYLLTFALWMIWIKWFTIVLPTNPAKDQN